MIILTWSRSTGYLSWVDTATGEDLGKCATAPTIDAAHEIFAGVTGGKGLTITTVP